MRPHRFASAAVIALSTVACGGVPASPAEADDAGNRETFEGRDFTVSYELPDEWALQIELDNALVLTNPSAEGPTAFLAVAHAQALVAYPGYAEDMEQFVAGVRNYEVLEEATVEHVASHVAEHPDLDVSEPTSVEVGGLDGVTMEVVNENDNIILLFRADPAAARVNRGDIWGVEPGSRAQLTLLQNGDRVTFITLEATFPPNSRDDAQFEAMRESAQPVLDSLEFE